MITDDEWDLIADLTEVLSTFANATEDLEGSKYVTNSMRVPMLMEIIKTVTTDTLYNQDPDEKEDDAFEKNSDFNLILNPPNYEKILFGFPYYREERLLHYKLYVFQQRFFNPDNIPKKKKTSLYQVSLHHLELWIEDSFVQIYDQPCFESLAFAWSRAQHGNIPFLDACNVYFNNNEIQTTPIKTHATLTKISHIGINLYDDKNLPEVWVRQSRDKDKKFYKDDIYSLWRWLLELIGPE
ncbi:hypothetical protein RhiirA1_476499 [Rhizophagus irregularis]|uniref:Uncharacterized protein n=1 Tax=Rhizophagus irregularis TaxID=588596 RepID=A0A2N0QV23_9GLOM|nr:hypothetical protein RhiirA1_476499 [Rhizophagus irregularis]